MESEEILGPQFTFTGQPAPQSLESDFLSPAESLAVSPFISVIIPNYNGAATIAICLEAVLASNYDHFEVIVVDDCSEDSSVAVIKKFSCRLIQLDNRSGAAAARNAGAAHSHGEILFFTDADCVLTVDALATAALAMATHGSDTIIGGTYTRKPYDHGFFSSFQTIFIHHAETKYLDNPDYIATHALVMTQSLFSKSGGFPEDFMPILEDVEFSHRMRKKGYRLYMHPHILVRHIFNYSFGKSMRNAVKKSKYWTLYSIKNRDLTKDSGTASVELKTCVLSLLLISILTATSCWLKNFIPLIAAVGIFGYTLFINRKLLWAFYATEGFAFFVWAFLYYIFIYPLAVATGAGLGILLYVTGKDQ
jgi:GT2 family glycosyltransferase